MAKEVVTTKSRNVANPGFTHSIAVSVDHSFLAGGQVHI